jgi:cell division protein ZapA
MPQVTLHINGFSYVLGCKDGEEEHLHAMAAEVDRRIDSVKNSAGPSGEARMLVIAALLMADELHDQSQRPTVPGEAAKPDGRLSRRLGRLAKRAEEIAVELEHP